MFSSSGFRLQGFAVKGMDNTMQTTLSLGVIYGLLQVSFAQFPANSQYAFAVTSVLRTDTRNPSMHVYSS